MSDLQDAFSLGIVRITAMMCCQLQDALTEAGVKRVITDLQQSFKCEFIICDSPAGIESGARHAMYLADDAILVTNPELSSCRDR